MPAIYAHALFGKKVYKTLSGECAKTVKKYKKYYALGLQGPDILFFYRPLGHNRVNRTGVRMHNETARYFMYDAKDIIRKYGLDSPECAYILGFICHFMLDSTCHPFVDYEAENSGIDHVSLETEFDNELMFEDGRDPYSYDLRKLLPYSKDMACHIQRFYEGISIRDINESVRSMRFAKLMLSADEDGAKGVLLRNIAKLPGARSFLYPHMIIPGKGHDCAYSNAVLSEMLEETVDKTAKLIMEYYDIDSYSGVEFNKNFSGGNDDGQ